LFAEEEDETELEETPDERTLTSLTSFSFDSDDEDAVDDEEEVAAELVVE